jgi:hypothetical protein
MNGHLFRKTVARISVFLLEVCGMQELMLTQNGELLWSAPSAGAGRDCASSGHEGSRR